MNTLVNQDTVTALALALMRLEGRPLDIELTEPGAEQTTASKIVRHFGFKMGHYHCAVPASIFCELIANPAIAPIPNSPDILLGLCNIRGTLVPAYTLHKLIDCPMPSIHRLLLVGRGQDCVGLIIDSLPASIDLDENQAQTTEEATHNSFNTLFDAVYQRNDINWYRLNPHRVGEILLALCQQEAKP